MASKWLDLTGSPRNDQGMARKSDPDLLHPTPKAVVLDANLWGEGILDIGQLRTHAERLGKSGIEVWIPTQVALEWASHARDHVRKASLAWKNLERMGLVSASSL